MSEKIGQVQIDLPFDEIATFCRQHQIRRLALFGSVLRDDFSPDSDLDLLVEFASGFRPGLFALGRMQMTLSELLGRQVDLKTAGFLNPRIRQKVKEGAVTIYEA